MADHWIWNPWIVGPLIYAAIGTNLMLGLWALALRRRKPVGWLPMVMVFAAYPIVAAAIAWVMLDRGVGNWRRNRAIERIRQMANPNG